MKNVAWNKVKVGSLCTRVTSGGTPKSTNAEYYDNGKIPWLNSKEVNFSHIYSTEKFITEKGLAESSAKWIEKNSVIVAMYGATAGQVAIAKIPLTTNQACCNLTIDDKLADYRYVYYYLWNQYQVLSGLANGGAQQNLNAQIIKEFEIQLPELSVQKSISEILFSLDEQIRINNTINHNLEEQAKAIFKSWFVDFEPFQDGGFVDSEHGQIPIGWRIGTFGEIANISSGKRPSKKSVLKSEECMFPLIGASCVMGFTCSYLYDTPIIVTGRVGTHGIIQYFDEKCWPSDNTLVIQSKFLNFAYQYLHTVDFTTLNRGSTQPLITQSDIKKQSCLIAPEYVMLNFEEKLQSIRVLIQNNLCENYKLAQLRDALLPKLMSGEIEVSEVEV